MSLAPASRKLHIGTWNGRAGQTLAPAERGMRTYGTMKVGEGPLPWILVALAFGIAVYAFFIAPSMVGG